MARAGRPRDRTGQETRERIIAQGLRRLSSGPYEAFSFRDLAADLDIRSASIHYHFPRKEDLGLALVDACSTEVLDRLNALPAAMSPVLCLRTFASRYRDLMMAGQHCPMGSLAASASTLPEPLSEANATFFRDCETWLEAKLKSARDDAALGFSAPPRLQARQFLALLQGLHVILGGKRDADTFDMIVDTYLADLAG